MIDKEFAARELKEWETRMSPAQKERLQLERLTLIEGYKLNRADPKLWSNKLLNMTLEEFELLPHGFIRKYGSMLNFMKRVEKEAYI